MNKFLFRLAAFLGLLLVTYTGLLLSVIALNVRNLDKCRLDESIDAVIVGDSHTMWSIDDANIQGLRNISLNAEGYRYTYDKLRHLLSSQKGIQKVYVGFGYHNFAGYYDDYIFGPTFRHFVHRYLSVLTWRDYLQIAGANPTGVPDLVKKVIQEGWKPGLKGECQLYGSFPLERKTQQFSESNMRQRIAEQFYEGGAVVHASASNIEYLQKIVDLVRENGAEVVVLNTPLHSEYKKRVPDEYLKSYARFIDENHLSHYDFQDLKLTDADFLPDGDHTNYAGSVLTTRRFKEHHEKR